MKLITVILFLFLGYSEIWSQEVVTDTFRIDFFADSLLPSKYVFSEVIDNRNSTPCLISYAKSKKLLIVPVDQEICLKTELRHALQNNSLKKLRGTDSIGLEINHFIIDFYSGRFSSFYVLEADLALHKNEEARSALSYNFKYVPEQRKMSKAEICEQILSKWHTQFKLDLLALPDNTSNVNSPKNILSNPVKHPHFLHTTLASVVGFNFWQVDAEIYFTRPETSTKSLFKAGIIRYQNTPELEMIGFGKRSEHYVRRINNKLLFDANMNILIGINKWKNTEDIKLQQVVQFSLSSAQTINFDSKNLSGVIIKVGIFENFYYIIEKTPKLQLGIYLGGGYKF
jgi:hypothetical protein